MLVGLGLLLGLGSGRQPDDAGNESKKFGWKGKLARAVFLSSEFRILFLFIFGQQSDE